MEKIKFTKIIENYNLKNYIPEIDTDKIYINTPEVNRPALQLAGFFDHFDKERVQILGNVEYAFIDSMERQNRLWVYEKLMSSGIPCLILCRGHEADDDLIEAGRKYNVPVLMTEWTTSRFDAELTRWLNVQLAPCITIHGVLVDVYGEGVLIMGESGIGKSEAALELIKRGHRLVTDDAVDIKEIDGELIGTSPKITIGMLEVRGIGIIDITALYGLSSVQESKGINLVMHFEHWKDNGDYDRLGINQDTQEILGVNVRKLRVPVRPGRNIAVIIEAAAVNYRHSLMSDISAVDIIERRMENLTSEDN